MFFLKKHVDVVVFHPQLRRYRCGNCNTPFTLVWPGVYSAQVEGFIGVEADDRLKSIALSKAAKALRSAIGRRRVGRGRCPSCNAMPTWMVLREYVDSVGQSAVIWTLAGAAPAAALYYLARYENMVVLASLVVAGFLLGLVIGRRDARLATTGPKGDPRTRTDADLNHHLRRCRREGLDPILTWADEALGIDDLDGCLVVPLGMHDAVGGFPVPPDLRPEAVLAVLDGGKRRA